MEAHQGGRHHGQAADARDGSHQSLALGYPLGHRRPLVCGYRQPRRDPHRSPPTARGEVPDHAPGARWANEYTPSLPDTVARMPLPSALAAVMVAPARGSLAVLLTTPTMAPNVILFVSAP